MDEKNIRVVPNPEDMETTEPQPEGESNKAKRVKETGKKKVVIFAVVVAVVAVIIAVSVLSGPSIEEITFEKSSYYMVVGRSGTATYTVVPSEATESAPKKIKWASSDPSIATVDENGAVWALSVGTCTITATASNGVESSFDLEVRPDMSNFKTLYETYLDSSYAQVAEDGSYLLIDTNPSDRNNYSSTKARNGLVAAVNALELPESLLQKMANTRAIDGMQTQTYDDLEVSWTYHPNKGLEVLFSKN